jgi:hypothetical protein
MLLLVVVQLTGGHVEAQILQGEWVERSQAEIDKHRKTEVAVIVLDRDDRAVRNAAVRVEQKRHDFVIGLTLPIDRMPPKEGGPMPVLRCFNAIALDRYTTWSQRLEASPAAQAERLGAWRKRIDPIRTHFGPVISADPARNHDRLALLGPAELRDAVLARTDLAAVFEPTPDSYDLYADLLRQDLLERKLGEGMLPRLFDRASARRPDAALGVRVREGISLRSGRDMVSRIQRLQVRQVAFDHVTIQQQFRGPLQPNALTRMFDEYVAALGVPVTLAGMEVSGPTPVAAAIHLEMLLRVAFAQPAVQGIYFAGLTDADHLEDNAALLNHLGKPTAAGSLLDTLFTEVWRSSEAGQTDESGNFRTRVFTGWYTITAKLPDGRRIETEAYIPKDDRARIVVLQVTAAEAK